MLFWIRVYIQNTCTCTWSADVNSSVIYTHTPIYMSKYIFNRVIVFLHWHIYNIDDIYNVLSLLNFNPLDLKMCSKNDLCELQMPFLALYQRWNLVCFCLFIWFATLTKMLYDKVNFTGYHICTYMYIYIYLLFTIFILSPTDFFFLSIVIWYICL